MGWRIEFGHKRFFVNELTVRINRDEP